MRTCLCRVVVVHLVAMALASCGLRGGDASSSGASDGSAPDASLTALAAGGNDLTIPTSAPPISDDEKSLLARQAALDLESFLNASPQGEALAGAGLAGIQTHEGRATPGDAQDAPPAPAVSATSEVLDEAALAWASEPAPRAAEIPATPTPGFAENDPVAGMARRMAALLIQSGQEAAGNRIPIPVALAAIESLQPGVLADLELPENSLHDKLTPEERATLLAARDQILSRPGDANEALLKSLSRISRPVPMRIARGLLCRRVQGFGRYELSGDSFIAGRPLRVIVYTELEGFGTRPAVEGDPAQQNVPLSEQITVDLTQSLTLYQEPSGLQAWHKPAAKVLETTRAVRRDFYLIHTIDLPATLSIGKYILKATVTDKVSGASDEVNIPISVVAK